MGQSSSCKADYEAGLAGAGAQAFVATSADDAEHLLREGLQGRGLLRGHVACSFDLQIALKHGDVALAVARLDEELIDKAGFKINTTTIAAEHFFPMCARPGCYKPTWTRELNSYCRPVCRDGTNFPLAKIDPADPKFKDIESQFTIKWDRATCGDAPKIKSMWLIHNQALLDNHNEYCEKIGDVKAYHKGKNPGNQQRRFHRTTMTCADSFDGTPCSNPKCRGCNIMKTGFLKKFLNPKPTWANYGVGFYSSPSSSYGVAMGGKSAAKFANGAVFVCKVAVGVPDIHDTTADLPSGTHSRIASSTTRNPADSELVVFSESAMITKYLILH